MEDAQVTNDDRRDRHALRFDDWLAAGRWRVLLLLWLPLVLAYSNSFSGVFLLDDIPQIEGNARLDSLAPSAHLRARRPLVSYSFAVNRALGDRDPAGYHVVNLLLHLAATTALYWLLRETLARRPRVPCGARPVALAVALLWGLHPLQTESVTYLIQRSEVAMALAYLLTLGCCARSLRSSQPWRWQLAGVAACAAGMGCKAVMVTAPLALLLYDWVFSGDAPAVLLRKRWRFHLACWATLLLLEVGGGVASGVFDSSGTRPATVGFSLATVTPWQYLRTQPEVILHYLRLALWPQPLCLHYGWPIAESALRYLSLGLVILALVGVSLRLVLRRSALGFAGLFFFVVLAPTSSVIPIRDLAFEHRMYLPLAALSSLGVWALAHLAERCRQPRFFPLVVVLVALIFAGVTFDRNRDYHSAVAMWRQTVSVRPDNGRAQHNLGVALLIAEQRQEARTAFARAVSLTPGLRRARLEWARLLAGDGALAQAEHQLAIVAEQLEGVRARGRFGQRLAQERRTHQTYRAEVRLARQQFAAAEKDLRELLAASAARGSDGEEYLLQLLADATAAQGKYAEAAAACRRILEINPDNALAQRMLDRLSQL